MNTIGVVCVNTIGVHGCSFSARLRGFLYRCVGNVVVLSILSTSKFLLGFVNYNLEEFYHKYEEE